MIKMIAAVSNDLAIGKDNKLLWHIPKDLEWFKRYTTGKTVVMGSKTWESLPESVRPLPDRKNLVLSREPDVVFIGAQTVTFEQVIELAATEEIVVIGGGEVYKLFLRYADELSITRVNIEVPDADTHFPEFKDEFEIDERVWSGRCPTSDLVFAIETFVRK
ncbi:dihydrofolate reductase [Vibrio coralliirubri]|uniref:dihydrofolate reductase n=1 Tax=Vibrio coralliirubri TaxID=1516159 RepID=UPI0022846D97|nr:dihydrofolate reductase [Vibrio coralliirubri]MCY9860942.1 dihydrofolate reductase [Vibrio coralliirubri]